MRALAILTVLQLVAATPALGSRRRIDSTKE